MKALDRALGIAPGDWGCLFVKGDVLRQVHQFDKAIEAFKAVQEARPEDAGVRIAIAGTYLDLARVEQGTGYLQRAETSLKTTIDLALSVIADESGFKTMAWKLIGDALYDLARRTSYFHPDEMAETLMTISACLPREVGSSAEADTQGKYATAQLAEGVVTGRVALALALCVYQTRTSVVGGSSEVAAGADFDVAVVLKQLAIYEDADGKTVYLKQAADLMKKAVRGDPTNASYWNALGIMRFVDDGKLAQHCFIMAIEADNKVDLVFIFYLHNH